MFRIARMRLRRWRTSLVAIYLLKSGTAKEREEAKALLQENEDLTNDNIRLIRFTQLLEDCIDYDIDLSDYDDIWEVDENGRRHLNAKGRATARKLLHDEKELRFANTARWVKLLVPIITGIAGLLGIITGLVAVLQHKK
jgi:hypothetical protein